MSGAVRTVTLAEVLREVATGAGSTAEVARRTGASPEVAEAALATLASAGRIRRVLVFAGACTTLKSADRSSRAVPSPSSGPPFWVPWSYRV